MKSSGLIRSFTPLLLALNLVAGLAARANDGSTPPELPPANLLPEQPRESPRRASSLPNACELKAVENVIAAQGNAVPAAGAASFKVEGLSAFENDVIAKAAKIIDLGWLKNKIVITAFSDALVTRRRSSSRRSVRKVFEEFDAYDARTQAEIVQDVVDLLDIRLEEKVSPENIKSREEKAKKFGFVAKQGESVEKAYTEFLSQFRNFKNQDYMPVKLALTMLAHDKGFVEGVIKTRPTLRFWRNWFHVASSHNELLPQNQDAHVKRFLDLVADHKNHHDFNKDKDRVETELLKIHRSLRNRVVRDYVSGVEERMDVVTWLKGASVALEFDDITREILEEKDSTLLASAREHQQTQEERFVHMRRMARLREMSAKSVELAKADQADREERMKPVDVLLARLDTTRVALVKKINDDLEGAGSRERFLDSSKFRDLKQEIADNEVGERDSEDTEEMNSYVEGVKSALKKNVETLSTAQFMELFGLVFVQFESWNFHDDDGDVPGYAAWMMEQFQEFSAYFDLIDDERKIISSKLTWLREKFPEAEDKDEATEDEGRIDDVKAAHWGTRRLTDEERLNVTKRFSLLGEAITAIRRMLDAHAEGAPEEYAFTPEKIYELAEIELSHYYELTEKISREQAERQHAAAEAAQNAAQKEGQLASVRKQITGVEDELTQLESEKTALERLRDAAPAPSVEAATPQKPVAAQIAQDKAFTDESTNIKDGMIERINAAAKLWEEDVDEDSYFDSFIEVIKTEFNESAADLMNNDFVEVVQLVAKKIYGSGMSEFDDGDGDKLMELYGSIRDATKKINGAYKGARGLTQTQYKELIAKRQAGVYTLAPDADDYDSGSMEKLNELSRFVRKGWTRIPDSDVSPEQPEVFNQGRYDDVLAKISSKRTDLENLQQRLRELESTAAAESSGH